MDQINLVLVVQNENRILFRGHVNMDELPRNVRHYYEYPDIGFIKDPPKELVGYNRYDPVRTLCCTEAPHTYIVLLEKSHTTL